ncbi:MAG: hypothetical protein LBE38_06450 [Deltaproteobacteria bacterium]|nr:hypothetical protein [Deltaproteobacteria bacterium]
MEEYYAERQSRGGLVSSGTTANNSSLSSDAIIQNDKANISLAQRHAQNNLSNIAPDARGISENNERPSRDNDQSSSNRVSETSNSPREQRSDNTRTGQQIERELARNRGVDSDTGTLSNARRDASTNESGTRDSRNDRARASYRENTSATSQERNDSDTQQNKPKEGIEDVPESFRNFYLPENLIEEPQDIIRKALNPPPLDDYQRVQDPYGPILKDLDSPLADVDQTSETEYTIAQQDDFAEEINSVITSYTAKHPSAAPPTTPSIPAPPPADLAQALYKQVMKDRDTAKATPSFHNNDFAPRTYNLVSNLNNWNTLGTKIRTYFEDASAPMRQFFAQAIGKGSEDLPINHAWSLFPGRQREVLNRLTKGAFSPLVPNTTGFYKPLNAYQFVI